MTKHIPQHNQIITRRRCITILATTVAAGLNLTTLPLTTQPANSKAKQNKITWQGIILGANASITLYTEKPADAEPLIIKMVKQAQKLERYFSLYQPTSLLTKLNQTGAIKNPPKEFYELIAKALLIAEKTEGRFDPTVQPLFTAYKALGNWPGQSPQTNALTAEQAQTLINWQNVSASKSAIYFKKPNMALTLNGIAQGYITDCAVEILSKAGFENCLINFGEYKALGHKPGAKGWNIQLGPNNKAKQGGKPIWTLKNGAIAASSKTGMILDSKTGLHHLIDPKTGGNQPAWQDIYIEASTATDADAASTALFATAPKDIKKIANRLSINKALLIKSNGETLQITS